MTNKFMGEVDASIFGEDYTLRLDMDGHARLETEYGEFDFARKVEIGLAVLSSKYINSFLAAALRDASGKLVKSPVMPDVSLDEIAKRCLDAFSLFRYGKTHDEWVKAAIKEKASSENPI